MSSLDRVTVLGAGLLGGQIAWRSAFKGKTVVAYDIAPDAIERCDTVHDIPAMAEKAGHVTMLQRSPSYVLQTPRQDPIANTLRRQLPDTLAYRITRTININKQNLIYHGSRRFPKQRRRLIRKVNAGALTEWL